MAGSACEREMRDYAAERLRQMIPGARIIHELVVGGCRADLAAVTDERITLAEIKSERDTLSRLAEQLRQFSRASHEVIVIAHERWFDSTPYNSGAARFVPSDALGGSAEAFGAAVWAYPELERYPSGNWRRLPYLAEQPQPHAARLLELCWRAELREEAFQHRITVPARATLPWLIREMAWHMTGKEIVRAVCRQLRQRPFPEADAPLSAAA